MNSIAEALGINVPQVLKRIEYRGALPTFEQQQQAAQMSKSVEDHLMEQVAHIHEQATKQEKLKKSQQMISLYPPGQIYLFVEEEMSPLQSMKNQQQGHVLQQQEQQSSLYTQYVTPFVEYILNMVFTKYLNVIKQTNKKEEEEAASDSGMCNTMVISRQNQNKILWNATQIQNSSCFMATI